VTKLFQRALQYCDPLKLHFELLGLYERTDQHKLAEELLEKMCKKFKNSSEVYHKSLGFFLLSFKPVDDGIAASNPMILQVWQRRILWLLKKKPEEIDNVMKHALLCLPQYEHIKFLSQVAILEFKSGVPDRGRSIFEKMLREFPKRIDLWSVYLDQVTYLSNFIHVPLC